MGAETHIDIRRLQEGGNTDPSDLSLTSSDGSINVYTLANGWDITLNTDLVELIDFTNFHNTFVNEETDWTSQHNVSLKHYNLWCSLSREEITVVNRSQAGSTNLARDNMFVFERATGVDNTIYIPMICVNATDCLACLTVAIRFGEGNYFNTTVMLLSDTPPNLSWCFAKNIPFNVIGKRNGDELLSFIEIPNWFNGRIEITINRLTLRSGSNVFSYKADQSVPSGYSYVGFKTAQTETFDVATFTDLSSFTDIVPTEDDKYGVLDVDFFVDSIDVLEIQSDHTIPDWIINDLCVHEALMQSKMKDIIIKNIQSNQIVTTNVIDQNSTNNEVPTAKAVYDFIMNNN